MTGLSPKHTPTGEARNGRLCPPTEATLHPAGAAPEPGGLLGRVAWARQTWSGLGLKAHGLKASPRERWVGGWVVVVFCESVPARVPVGVHVRVCVCKVLGPPCIGQGLSAPLAPRPPLLSPAMAALREGGGSGCSVAWRPARALRGPRVGRRVAGGEEE